MNNPLTTGRSPLAARAETADDLSAYIMGIYRAYIESSAAISEYMLSSAKTGRGVLLSEVFRRFYSDFYRLFMVTRGLNMLKESADKQAISDWFAGSRQVLDKIKFNRAEDREKVFDYAAEGLRLSQSWVDALYNKQIIRTVK